MLQNQDLDEICIHAFRYGIVTKNNTTADINDSEFILKSWTVLKVSKTWNRKTKAETQLSIREFNLKLKFKDL